MDSTVLLLFLNGVEAKILFNIDGAIIQNEKK